MLTMKEITRLFRVEPGTRLRLKKHDSAWAGDKDLQRLKSDELKAKARTFVEDNLVKLAEAQDRLASNDIYSVLVVLQAIDAAGKDGMIKHVMSGLNPQGCQVFSFKRPSEEELDHDFLWRYWRALPERGRIGIFNRSYYEETLVVRVHPEVLDRQRLPPGPRDKAFWADRYEDINAFEKHMARNGTLILKFFLNISKKEQKKRFMERLERPGQALEVRDGRPARARVLGRLPAGVRGHAQPDEHRLRAVVGDSVGQQVGVARARLRDPDRVHHRPWPQATTGHRGTDDRPARGTQAAARRTRVLTCRGRLLLASVLVCASAVLGVAGAQAPAPTEVRDLLARQLTLGAAQIEDVRRGLPVAVAVPPTVDREIAVAGAVRIAAPASRLVAVIRDIERLERGAGFLATGKLSSPPSVSDMATPAAPGRGCPSAPHLPSRPLRRQARARARSTNWVGSTGARPTSPTRSTQLARRMALAYVEQYRASGNRSLAVYRDTARPIDIAAEFEDMVRRSSTLTETLPEVSAYLLQYPQARPASVDDFFYWSLAEFGLKPVVRLNHVVIHPTGRPTGLQYVVTTKQLYASHYFHTALEVRALVDDPERPGQGHYLVVLNLARSDGLTGLIGGIVKGKARTGARNGLQAALASMKRLAEGRQ